MRQGFPPDADLMGTDATLSHTTRQQPLPHAGLRCEVVCTQMVELKGPQRSPGSTAQMKLQARHDLKRLSCLHLMPPCL